MDQSHLLHKVYQYRTDEEIEELQLKTSEIQEFKREFAAKSEFLYDQVQQTKKTSLAQIEEYGRQLIEMKQAIN